MDYQRIDRYMDYHFSDEVGDKVCVLYVNEDNGPRMEWDLQYLEERILLQEELITSVQEENEIENRSMAYILTKRNQIIDEICYDLYGTSFVSPTGKKVDVAEYIYELEPEVYYDIAQSFIAGEVSNLIAELEESGRVDFLHFYYVLEDRNDG